MKVRRLKVWLIQLLFLVVLLGAAAQSALAQKAYPTKPIDIVNSFSPGGANDLNIRALSTAANRILASVYEIIRPTWPEREHFANRPRIRLRANPGLV